MIVACMLHFDLVSILFGTSIPTSFNILVKMFLHLFHCNWLLLCVATRVRISLLTFVQSSTSLAYIPITASNVSDSYMSCIHEYCLLSRPTAGPVA